MLAAILSKGTTHLQPYIKINLRDGSIYPSTLTHLPSACPHIPPPFTFPNIYSSILLSFLLSFHPPIHLSIHPPIHLSIHPLTHSSIHSSINPPFIHLPTHSSIHPSIPVVIHSFICLFTNPSICPLTPQPYSFVHLPCPYFILSHICLSTHSSLSSFVSPPPPFYPFSHLSFLPQLCLLLQTTAWTDPRHRPTCNAINGFSHLFF